MNAFSEHFKSNMGVKLIVVCGLVLLMSIPAFFVSGLADDRATRAEEVVKDVAGHVGGPQTFLGPTVAIPYSTLLESPADFPKRGVYFVFPAQAAATLKTSTEERHRSLFKVPIFQADLKFDATFDLSGVPTSAPPGAQLDWSRAELAVGVSDVRGALSDATLTADTRTTTLAPAEIAQNISIGGSPEHPVKLSLLGVNAAGVVKPDAKFHATSTVRFSGAQRVAVLAYGKSTRLTAQGDWRNPGFDGGFLPSSRNLTSQGFAAEWSVPFIARNVRAEGTGNSIAGLDTTALGVSFVELDDPYHSVSRSLKYVFLLVGLVFLSYFVFEATSGKQVHPAQYIMVGIAQIIFYLLLLSLAERIGFTFGFMLAGAATVILLSMNAGWIFSSRLQGTRALAIFSLLYSLIYTLLTLEDNAMLVGAIASFLAVAAAMYFTRGIDWYRCLPTPGIGERSKPSAL